MGKNKGQKPSDSTPHPERFRVSSVLFAADYLASLAMSDSTASYRVGAISFGSSTKVDLALTEIKPKNIEQWASNRQEISHRLWHTGPMKRSHLNAFQLARRMLDEAVIDDIDARQQIVIIIMDGELFIEPKKISISNYFNDILGYRSSYFPPNDVSLWSIIVHNFDLDGSNRIHSYLQKITNNKVVTANSSSDFFESMGELLTKEIPSNTVRIGSMTSFTIQPNTTNIILTVFSANTTPEVSLFKPDGSTISSSRLDGVSERIDKNIIRFRLTNPPPGIWRVESNQDPILLLFSEAEITWLGFMAPTGAILQFEQAEVTFHVLDGNGALYQEMPNHPLNLEVELTGPDKIPIKVTARKESNAVYKASFVPYLDGFYNWQAIGKTVAVEGNQIVIFEQQGALKVLPATPVEFLISQPESNSRFPIHTGWIPLEITDVPIILSVVERDTNELIDLNKAWVGDDPASLLQVELVGADNTTFPVAISYEAETKQFLANVSDLERAGEYKLEIDMPASSNFQTGYSVPPSAQSVTISFERYVSVYYRVWQSVLAVALLLILAGTAWRMALFINRVGGFLRVYDQRGALIKAYNLSRWRSNRIQLQNELPDELHPVLKRMLIKRDGNGIKVTLLAHDGSSRDTFLPPNERFSVTPHYSIEYDNYKYGPSAESWTAWEKEVGQELFTSHQVSPRTNLSIPKQFRRKAIERYFERHRKEYNLIFDQQMGQLALKDADQLREALVIWNLIVEGLSDA